MRRHFRFGTARNLSRWPNDENRMQHYLLYSLDRTGRVCLACDFEAVSDLAALEEARLARTTDEVEVWQRDRLAAGIKKNDADWEP